MTFSCYFLSPNVAGTHTDTQTHTHTHTHTHTDTHITIKRIIHGRDFRFNSLSMEPKKSYMTQLVAIMLSPFHY